MLPSLQTSSTRPVPVTQRSDLVIQPIPFRGVLHYVVKDPLALNYHSLSSHEHFLLRLLDGSRSLEEIRSLLTISFPDWRPSLTDVSESILRLGQLGIVQSQSLSQAGPRLERLRKTRWKKFVGALRSVLSIRLPGFDPDHLLDRMVPWCGWVFHPAALIAVLLFVIATTGWVAGNWSQFQAELPEFQQFFSWPNLMYLWCVLAGAKVIHEFGHGLSCKYYGGECHQMGVMLLAFSPCLYCDVSDSWLLVNKWKRIMIAAAGMYFELVLSALGALVFLHTQPGLIHYLSLNLLFVTMFSTVVFNANPLMKLDGYYILSDWLEVPNLRTRAYTALQDGFHQLCFGIEPPRRPGSFSQGAEIRTEPWFILYAIMSTIYGWMVFGGILLAFTFWLRPYELSSVGITLALSSLGMLLVTTVTQSVKVVRTPRQQPLSRPRMAVSFVVLAAIFWGLLSIPIPWYRPAEFVLEPLDVRNIYSAVPGQIRTISVRPGQQVAAGDVLLELVDEARDLQILKVSQDLAQQMVMEKTAAALDDPAARMEALESQQGLLRQLTELRAQRDQLTVRAPVAGVVVNSPRKPASTQEALSDGLPVWHGTPLSRRNIGAFVEAQTQLLSIAPDHSLEAVLYLDQEDRHDVSVGQEVRLKIDLLPAQTFVGTVLSLSEANSDFAPAAMSNKQGGRLATTTDKQGREKLIDAAYQAVVRLDRHPELIRPGVRGQARFIISERTGWQWIYRAWRRLFDFSAG